MIFYDFLCACVSKPGSDHSLEYGSYRENGMLLDFLEVQVIPVKRMERLRKMGDIDTLMSTYFQVKICSMLMRGVSDTKYIYDHKLNTIRGYTLKLELLRHVRRSISQEELDKDNVIFGNLESLIDNVYGKTVSAFSLYSKPPYKYEYYGIPHKPSDIFKMNCSGSDVSTGNMSTDSSVSQDESEELK